MPPKKWLCLAPVLCLWLMTFVTPLSARSFLVDFGTGQSYRGVSVPAPDANGNYWNGARPGAATTNLVDLSGTASGLALSFSTSAGTDSYNGPAGATSNPPTTTQITATDIDATALGVLGIKEAAIDYVSGTDVRLTITGLDPVMTYHLVLFGSHKYSTDSTTAYEVYTDSACVLLSGSTRLNVQDPAQVSQHNRKTVAKLADLRPSANGTLYLRLHGTGGNAGYLNSLQIVEGSRPYDGPDTTYVWLRNPASGLELSGTGAGTLWMTANPAATEFTSQWYLTSGTDTSAVWVRNRITGEALRAATDSGPVTTAAWNPDDPRQKWLLQTGTNSSGQSVIHLQLASGATLTASTQGAAPLVANAAAGSASQEWALDALPRGAAVPWTTYDEDNYSALLSPASVVRTTYGSSFDIQSRAAEAQKQACIILNGYGTSVQWIVSKPANALTLRYNLNDGDAGTITMRITKVSGTVTTQKVQVTSAQAWVYLDAQGVEYDQAATGRTPAKRYNEARIKLDVPLETGDTLEFRRDNGDAMTWIDLVEAETASLVPSPNSTGYLDVTAAPYYAVGDGVANDTTAIKNCIAAAASAGKSVYLPRGTYRLEQELIIPAGLTIQGAGMWYTELVFSLAGSSTYGGIKGNGSGIVLRDLYIRGAQSSRSGGYKALKGYWGTNSLIENVWVEQTEVGAWIADLDPASSLYTDGLVMRNCRFRNVFADGVNYASGTRNSVVENCHVRGAGDDGLASWASGRDDGKPTTRNQQFRYNTVECVYRAGGVALFGGEGHKIHHNVIRDQVAGPGVRMNTVFMYTSGTLVGYPFGSQVNDVYENTLERTGSLTLYGEQSGAIDLQTWYDDVANLHFSDLSIQTTRYSAIRFSKSGTLSGPIFSNVAFLNLAFSGAPIGTQITSSAAGSASYDQGAVSAGISNHSANFQVIALPPPPPVISSFSPGSAAPGTAVVISGTYLGSTTSVLFSGSSAASFNVVDNSTVSAVVPNGAVDGRITLVTLGGTANSFSSLTILKANTAPVISLNMPGAVTLPAGTGLQLDATVTDDQLPSPHTVTTIWSVVSQPAGGGAVFDDAFAASTGVKFNTPGTYLLRLTASDGQYSPSADVACAYGISSSEQGGDVGAVGVPGSYTKLSGTITVNGAGTDIWDTSDGFYFLSAPLAGDGYIQARVLSQAWTHDWAKAGVMIRDALDAGSSHVLLATTPANGLAFQNRPTAGSISVHQSVGSYSFPVWLKLVRSGTSIYGFRSDDGATWTQLGSASPSMSGTVYVGLAVTSHNNGVLGKAVFDNLQGSGFGVPGISVTAGGTASGYTSADIPIAGLAAGATSTQWMQRSGPATLSISSPATLQTSVLASLSGTYTLRLLAQNASLRTFDDLVLTAVLDRLRQWQITHFGDPAAPDAALSADPDGDTVCNLLEFALGSDPKAKDAALFAPRALSGTSGLIFQFRRRTGGSGSTEAGYLVDGISYLVETTSVLNPVNWRTGATVIQQMGAPLDNGDGTETVTVQALGSGPSAFIRLRVTGTAQ